MNFCSFVLALLVICSAGAEDWVDEESGGRYFPLDGMMVDMFMPEAEESPSDTRVFDIHQKKLSEDPLPSRQRPIFFLQPPAPPRGAGVQERISKYLSRAEQLARKGNLQGALYEIRDALALNPDNAFLLSRAASYATSARNFERAADYFRRFLDIHPEDPSHVAAYSMVLLRLNRFAEVQRLLASLDPQEHSESLALQFTRLCLALLEGREEPSRHFWRTRPINQIGQVAYWLHTDREVWGRLVGAEDFPRLCAFALGPGTHEGLEEILSQWNVYETAARAGDIGMKMDVLSALQGYGLDSLGIEAARADLLFQAGDIGSSLELWRQILEQEPTWAEGLFQYGYALLRADRFVDAAATLQTARRQMDTPIIQLALASALALSGEQNKAQNLFSELVSHRVEDLRKWLEIEPLFHDALRRMNNYPNLARRIGIPPEME